MVDRLVATLRGADRGLRIDRAGSAAVIVGLALPVLLSCLLLVLDFGTAVSTRSGLQGAADAGALAGARELMILAQARTDIAQAVAAAVARDAAASLAVKPGTLEVETILDEQSGRLSVVIDAEAATFLAEVVLGGAPAVGARAAALPVGDRSLCVIGLAEAGTAISAGGDASISAIGCTVYANSSGTQSLTLTQRAKVAAESVCSAGGFRGDTRSVTPAPRTDCPKIEDPLQKRPRPDAAACTYKNRSINHTSATWGPGVYCGGMYLNNGARVTLKPGVYVLKGGTLNVEGGARLEGAGVTLFLTDGARLNVLQTSTLNLSAPAQGAMAGILFFGDKDSPPASAHIFRSNDARLLLGTVYLPDATLRIGGARPIADQSPWTAVLAGRIQLEGSAAIVLNSRFDETDVPLPSGLAGLSRNVRLAQ